MRVESSASECSFDSEVLILCVDQLPSWPLPLQVIDSSKRNTLEWPATSLITNQCKNQKSTCSKTLPYLSRDPGKCEILIFHSHSSSWLKGHGMGWLLKFSYLDAFFVFQSKKESWSNGTDKQQTLLFLSLHREFLRHLELGGKWTLSPWRGSALYMVGSFPSVHFICQYGGVLNDKRTCSKEKNRIKKKSPLNLCSKKRLKQTTVQELF